VENGLPVLNKANGRIAYRIFISSWDRQRDEPPCDFAWLIDGQPPGAAELTLTTKATARLSNRGGIS
jgi:hypothetical protein